MIRRASLGALLVSGACVAALVPAAAGDDDDHDDDRGGSRSYAVTITNLTEGQPLTPPVVATHSGKNQLFKVGRPASVGVREIAENGNSAPLLAFLGADPFDRIADFKQAGSGPLVPKGKPGAPGIPPDPPTFADSVSFEITAAAGASRLSFVSMLVCTNDGFTGINGLTLPGRVGRTVSADTQGYDAHTEQNHEDFAQIVPPCQGLIGVSSGEPGMEVSNPALAEGGVIAHHENIEGGPGHDLVPAVHGWDDPVAEITVERVG
jgi:Spondin_N